ncbi:MAG: SCP2 sterol-binding domain-containing protein [Steroidobacteraceae bacterium]
MLTERIEAVLNRQAQESPRALALLKQLEGRTLRVLAQFTPFQLDLHSDGAALLLERQPTAGAVDAEIRGTPLSLLRLASSEPEAAIRDGSVSISGDAEIANRFRELMQLLRPEVEEELSRLIGSTPANFAARTVSGLMGWTKNAGRTAARNVHEYLAHETGDLIPRTEAADFLEGVDRLREAADRLEARVRLLEARRS